MKSSCPHLSSAAALLLMTSLLATGCGPSDGGGIDGGPGPATTTTQPAATGTTGTGTLETPGDDASEQAAAEPTARPSGAAGRAGIDAGRVNAICQQALDSYQRNKDPDNPVNSQIAANQAVSGAANQLGAMGSSALRPLVDALRAYAANGAARAVAMDKGDFETENRLYEESTPIGRRVEAAAARLHAATCARLAGI